MATGYYTLTKAADPQTVCTLFEAEPNIDACTVAGTIGETDTDPIIGDDAVWEGTLTIDATGGTFTIGDGTTQTSALAEDITAANLQVAIRALAAYVSGTTGAAVTGSAGGPYTIVLHQDDPPLVAVGASLTGGTAGYITVVNTSEFVDTVTIDAGSGTFTIGIAGDQTAAQAEDASSATLQTALRNLTGLGAQLTATGDGPHVITRVDEEATPITVVNVDLGGGIGIATIATTQAAHDADEILVFPNHVVFKVTGNTVSAITTAAAALISDTSAYVEVASGYPAVAI